MTFKLEHVVPWGRSFDEYQRMFALNAIDLQKCILGCADGPASFCMELTGSGGQVTSCDPLYSFSATEIQQRIDATQEEIYQQTLQNVDSFLWTDFADPESLVRHRLATMKRFLEDYEAGKQAKRYIAASLPHLPFEDSAFDIAICSHFLFLYSEQLSEQFHVEALQELARVAPDVRIFPLLELGSVPSRHLGAIHARLAKLGFELRVERVDYEFQKGGNQMLRITR